MVHENIGMSSQPQSQHETEEESWMTDSDKDISSVRPSKTIPTIAAILQNQEILFKQQQKLG